VHILVRESGGRCAGDPSRAAMSISSAQRQIFDIVLDKT